MPVSAPQDSAARATGAKSVHGPVLLLLQTSHGDHNYASLVQKHDWHFSGGESIRYDLE